MHQISLTKSERAQLTAEQYSAWDERGFLILKSHLSSAEVARLGAVVPGTDEYAAAHEELVRSVAEPVGKLMGADPVLLSVRSGMTEPFGLDALDPTSGPTIRSATAVVMLQDSSSASCTYRFFGGSHLIALDAPGPDRGEAMFRIAQEIRDRGLVGEALTVAAGDVWLRHPRLVRGVSRTQADGPPPAWLTTIFGRAEDLPRAGLSSDADGGEHSMRSVFAASVGEISSIGRRIAVA